MNKSLLTPFNDQIASEFTAAAQYIAIAAYFEDAGLTSLAQFYFRQSAEEREHALKFVQFTLDSGEMPVISGLPNLKNSFTSAAEAVGYALEQENLVTDQIHNLVDLSLEAGDHASYNFLQWFVAEQVEEVATMSDLLRKIELAGPNLLLVDEIVRNRPASHAPAE